MDRGLILIGRLDIKGMDQCKRVYSENGIAPTITTCGGGQHEVKIFDTTRHRVRKLTPTEYGRLQAFPMETWEQTVSDAQAYKQFGNAVTVNVVRAVARCLRTCLENYKEFYTRCDESPSESSQSLSGVSETEECG